LVKAALLSFSKDARRAHRLRVGEAGVHASL